MHSAPCFGLHPTDLAKALQGKLDLGGEDDGSGPYSLLFRAEGSNLLKGLRLTSWRCSAAL
ncbi:hypothetical protein M378DRAFT_163604 [Amanita muscaria Koide BX008]|uniref:Uncharacterized protein n=1 Tax=Amanita muscaria (strain Koide BX008) TaxID=946122 RepID=A0A0C2SLS2_AMAMK|nr:hypothetical protein M378DRAFT_163604 [Amanita muscaria Koide BX008]